jgi:hypothetical protein
MISREDALELLQAQAHPITLVYVDEYGFIHYERDRADDIILGSTPQQSRAECAYRADAVCSGMDLTPGSLEGGMSMSRVHTKLTFRAFYEQSCNAIIESKRNQARHNEKVVALHRKEGQWAWRPQRIE